MKVIDKLLWFAGVAMVITSLTLKGRSPQESAVLKGLTSFTTGTIQAAEGQT